MTPIRLPIEGNRQLLHQGLVLLARLDQGEYGDPRGSWAPVGAQYRHILEHYFSFLDGLPEGRVDYDARARDLLLERDREAAAEATRAILARLDALDPGADLPVLVQMDTGGSEESPDWRSSSRGRELQFLCSHTVHHFALIKLLLDGAVDLGAEFGVAPSTLAHQRVHR